MSAIKSQRIQELYDERAKLHAENTAALDAAEKDKRGLSAEEKQAYDARDKQIDALGDEIALREKHAEREAYLSESRGRTADVAASIAAPISKSKDIELEFGSGRKVRIAANSPDARRCTPEYEAEFRDYLTNGRVSAGLLTASDPKGGYLAPMVMATGLIKFLDNENVMRQLATVLPPIPNNSSMGVLSYDTDIGDADWTPEVPASDISEDDAARFGRRELSPHLNTKMVKISRKLMRTSTIDIEGFMTGRIGYKHDVAQEKGFLTGNGAQKPLGVFTASDDGISTGRDTTCASTSDCTPDELITSLDALKDQYKRNATLLTSREFITRLRKKKDGQGQYLWQPGLQAGQPSLVLGRPYVTSEYVNSTFTTGLYVGIWGDFKTGYYIVDSLSLEIQMLGELFALKNQVGILGRMETDGMPVLEEAFQRIKLG